MKAINYKGKGEHSVRELELIIEQQAEELHLIKSGQKQCNIDSVGNRYDAKYTPPFRVGRRQGKAVLDSTGREVIFFKDSEEQAKKYCDYLNGC